MPEQLDPLETAAESNDREKCEEILNSTVEEESVKTAMFRAVRNNAVDALTTLLDYGDERTRLLRLNARYKEDRTPLAVAADFMCTDSAQLLLEKGAKADAQDEKGQPAVVSLMVTMPHLSLMRMDRITAQLLIGSWWAISTILFINIFIALLSETFSHIYATTYEHVTMERAIVVIGHLERMTGRNYEIKDITEFQKIKQKKLENPEISDLRKDINDLANKVDNILEEVKGLQPSGRLQDRT